MKRRLARVLRTVAQRLDPPTPAPVTFNFYGVSVSDPGVSWALRSNVGGPN